MLRAQLQPKHHKQMKIIKWAVLIGILAGCQLFLSPIKQAKRAVEAGQFDQAIEDLTALSKNQRADPLFELTLAEAYRARALSHLTKDRCALAMGDYEAAADASRRQLADYEKVGACFHELKQPLPPKLAHILYEFGDRRISLMRVLLTGYIDKDNYAKAEPVARALNAQRLFKTADAKWLVGQALANKHYQTAQFWLNQMHRRDPENAYLMTRIAMVAHQQKAYETANGFFEKVHLLRPTNRVILAQWRHTCAALEKNECLEKIDRLLKPSNSVRNMRPLPASRR